MNTPCHIACFAFDGPGSVRLFGEAASIGRSTTSALALCVVAQVYRRRGAWSRKACVAWPQRRRPRLALCARDGQGYSWEEAGRYNEEVRIYIPLGQGEKAADVDFALSEGSLRVGVKGRAPVVEGQLFRAVEMEDSDWMIDWHEGKRSIVVTLTKVNVREGWRHLLREDAPPDELPGPDKVVSNKLDLSVLGQLDRVQALLQQRRLDEARELMNIMTADIQEALPISSDIDDSKHTAKDAPAS